MGVTRDTKGDKDGVTGRPLNATRDMHCPGFISWSCDKNPLKKQCKEERAMVTGDRQSIRAEKSQGQGAGHITFIARNREQGMYACLLFSPLSLLYSPGPEPRE